MTAELIRFYGPEQTLGMFVVRNDGDILFTCATLELPDLGNRRNISCIPEGKYTVVKRDAHPSRSYTHFHVKDVPGRTWILLHIGNYNFHIKGCVLVGKYHSNINADGLLDVVNSTETLARMVEIMPESFELNIRS